MLVISRNPEERVVITDTRTGECILLMVTKVRGNKVYLGFEATRRFRIDRMEVAQARAAQEEPT